MPAENAWPGKGLVTDAMGGRFSSEDLEAKGIPTARLDAEKLIGSVPLSVAQMSFLLEGIDWRNPQHSWRPASAG